MSRMPRMDIFLLIVFIVGLVLAIVGLFVPRRLFEIGVLIAILALALRVFAGV